MKNIVLMTALALSTVSFAQDKEKWPDYSNPAIVSSTFELRMDKLPLEGHHDVPHTGWSDDYWPTQLGSINRRWTAPGQPGFDLKSPNLAIAKSMSEKEISQLAPTEKYDLWRGRYDYPLVKRVDGNADPKAKDWAGICNGWSPASLNLKEPQPIVMTNADGIKIPFGSSDIKALLSFYYAYEVNTPTQQIGLRCFVGRGLRVLARGCGDDVNAGAFHIIMANKLGLERKGFLADVDRLKEVWNQPITGFTSKILQSRPASSGASKQAVSEVLVQTDLTYGSEIEPQWEAVLGTSIQTYEKIELEYTVELDAQGKIVGGKWESWIRPDFLWFRGKAPFTGDFKDLEKLYEAATQY
ncbi:MAG: hypothetical protein K2P81_06880 [Bacteriovoracaceae bacterium]|nr:hypothetical protein [Bacteriovoracaceae bacterium]